MRLLRRAKPTVPRRDAPERRVEELGRALASRGAEVYLQPTVAHRAFAMPVLASLLAAAFACLLGLLLPRVGALLLLALALSVLADAEGGRGWLRLLLPRRAGWLIEAELPGATSPQQPTIVLWAPVPTRSPAHLSDPGLARLALFLPVALGAVAALCLVLDSAFPWPAFDLLVLGAAAGELLAALLAAIVFSLRRPLKPERDPSTLVASVVKRLMGRPLDRARVLLVVGSEGPAWYDDLEVWLRNRRHRFEAEQTLLVALQPGRGPLGVVELEGVLRPRKAPPRLVAALEGSGLPRRTGRTGALRARRLGLHAVGIQGAELQAGSGPEQVEAALRSLSSLLRPEDA